MIVSIKTKCHEKLEFHSSLKEDSSQVLGAHTCNPSYLGG
jgi:hypothetical protein